MPDRAADIARRLAEQAEAVCRHYLSKGRREGGYWLVGDADNTPGRSLFVRLKAGEAGKPAGKWTDAATGEHGDLLDIIARRERLTTLGAAASLRQATMTDDPTQEPHHATSPTGHILEQLALYGHRPFEDEPDPRHLPEVSQITGAIVDIFDALVVTLQDSRLEPDLETLLWGQVNLFHRTVDRIERELDDNEQAQKRSQREQDGSEVRSVELERLLAEGMTLIERRNAFELMRDLAAEQFETHNRHAWRPHAGSMVNRKALTAAMIDSRDFLAARKRAETEVMLPAGPKIAFTGGLDVTDPGLPDDIGPMIASLLSEDNRWVNAQRIEVSGGQAI